MALRLDHAAADGSGHYHFAYWGEPTPIPSGGHVDVPVTLTNDGGSSVSWQGPNGSGSHDGFDTDKLEFASCPTNGTTIAAGASVAATIRVKHNPAGNSSWSNSIFLTYRAGGFTYTIHASLFNQWPASSRFAIAVGDSLFTGPPTHPVQVDGSGDPVNVTSITVDDQSVGPDYGLISFLTASSNYTAVRVRLMKGIASTFQLDDTLDPTDYPGSSVPDYSGALGPSYNAVLPLTSRWSYGTPTRNATTGAVLVAGTVNWRQIAGARLQFSGAAPTATPTSIVVRELHPTPVSTSSITTPWYFLSYPHRDHTLLINQRRRRRGRPGIRR